MSFHGLTKKCGALGVKQGDLIVVALLLVLSAALAFAMLAGRDGTANSARICVNGEQVALLPLDTDAVYAVPGSGYGNVVEVSGGRVRMLSAKCPDESCVGQGFISNTGECIICIPGRVTVTIISGSQSDGLDAVAY